MPSWGALTSAGEDRAPAGLSVPGGFHTCSSPRKYDELRRSPLRMMLRVFPLTSSCDRRPPCRNGGAFLHRAEAGPPGGGAPAAAEMRRMNKLFPPLRPPGGRRSGKGAARPAPSSAALHFCRCLSAKVPRAAGRGRTGFCTPARVFRQILSETAPGAGGKCSLHLCRMQAAKRRAQRICSRSVGRCKNRIFVQHAQTVLGIFSQYA